MHAYASSAGDGGGEIALREGGAVAPPDVQSHTTHLITSLTVYALFIPSSPHLTGAGGGGGGEIALREGGAVAPPDDASPRERMMWRLRRSHIFDELSVSNAGVHVSRNLPFASRYCEVHWHYFFVVAGTHIFDESATTITTFFAVEHSQTLKH
jgi:hypothetical protein